MASRNLIDCMTAEEYATLSTCRDHPAIRGMMKLLRHRMSQQHAVNRARPVLSDEVRKDLRAGLGREWELEETIAEIETVWERN